MWGQGSPTQQRKQEKERESEREKWDRFDTWRGRSGVVYTLAACDDHLLKVRQLRSKMLRSVSSIAALEIWGGVDITLHPTTVEIVLRLSASSLGFSGSGVNIGFLREPKPIPNFGSI